MIGPPRNAAGPQKSEAQLMIRGAFSLPFDLPRQGVNLTKRPAPLSAAGARMRQITSPEHLISKDKMHDRRLGAEGFLDIPRGFGMPSC